VRRKVGEKRKKTNIICYTEKALLSQRRCFA